MNPLQDLIDTANRLSARLEESANNEKKFCVDIQIRLEQMSWEIYRTASELKCIQEIL